MIPRRPSNPGAEEKTSKESMPKWVADEIKNAKFENEEEWTGSGYILDINQKENKVDIQFYEKLPEGRYIATLDLPAKFDTNTLELATVYMFKFKASKATLNSKVVSFLKEKFELDMDSIYKFELISAEKLDAEAESPPPQASEEEDDE